MREVTITLSKRELKVKFAIMLIMAVILGVSCLFSSAIEKFLNIGISGNSGKYIDATVLSSYDMRLHYLDVGQADCTFIELPSGESLLIDAGTTATGSSVVEYIRALGYSTIDYFVLTHCDADHVGGAVDILNAFEVINIFRPLQFAGTYSTKEDGSSTTAISYFVCYGEGSGYYEDLADIFYYLRDADKANKLARVTTDVYAKTITAIYAETYTAADGIVCQSNVSVNFDGLTFGDAISGYSVEFFAPLITEDNFEISTLANMLGVDCRTTGYITQGYGATTSDGKNAISPLILLEYKSNSFVFTGDMTSTAEADVIASLTDDETLRLSDITVYQAGHHGAKTSNSMDFLTLLNPKFVVVSSNTAGNNYGHPHQEFLDRLAELENYNSQDFILRTDTVSNIMFGVAADGSVGYNCNIEISNSLFEIAWWQIAIGIFIVFSIILWSIKMPPPKKSKKQK